MIDTTEALKVIEDAHALAEKLNGLDETDLVGKDNNKNRTAVKAAVARDLMFAAHLCEAARVELLNQYWAYKGQNPPAVTATTDEYIA